MKKIFSFILCLTILMGTFTCLGFTASAEDKADPGYYEAQEPAQDLTSATKSDEETPSLAEIEALKEQIDSLPVEEAEEGLAPVGAAADLTVTSANIDGVFAHVTSYSGGQYLSTDDNDYLIVEARDNYSRSQLWWFYPIGNSLYVIMNIGNGQVLELVGGNAKNGASIWTNTLDSNIPLKQQWYVIPLSDSYQIISAVDTSYCIERTSLNTSTTQLYEDTNDALSAFNIKVIPVVDTAQAASNGVKVSWLTSYDDGTRYRLFRQEYLDDEGVWSSWKTIANTTATSYVDTTAKTDKVYYYTVRCINNAGSVVGDYDGFGTRIFYRSIPKLTRLYSFSGYMRFVWSGYLEDNQVFRIFRKVNSGKWEELGDTDSTTYADYNVTYGTKYTYTVRIYDEQDNVYASYFNTSGKSLKYYNKYYCQTPSLVSVTNVAGGVQFKWGATAMEDDNYRIFRKSGSSGWKKVKDVSGTTTSYTDKSVKNGTKYAYTVRVVYNGTNVSGYNTTGKAITYYAAPKVTALKKTSSGIQIVWSKTAGVPKYRVFRQVYNASTGKWSAWTKVGDTSNTTGVDTNVKKNKKYRYAVRCMDKNKTKYLSAFIASSAITYK